MQQLHSKVTSCSLQTFITHKWPKKQSDSMGVSQTLADLEGAIRLRPFPFGNGLTPSPTVMFTNAKF